MIFLIGHHASGKDTVGRILADDFNFLHIESSQIVRDYREKVNPDMDMSIWPSYIEGLYGQSYLDGVIVDEFTRSLGECLRAVPQDVAVTGNRTKSGIDYIMSNLPEGTPNLRKLIVAVSCPEELLHERFIKRKRNPNDEFVTRAEFHKILDEEGDRGLTALLDEADYTLTTDVSEDKLKLKTKLLFSNSLGYKLSVERC